MAIFSAEGRWSSVESNNAAHNAAMTKQRWPQGCEARLCVKCQEGCSGTDPHILLKTAMLPETDEGTNICDEKIFLIFSSDTH